MAAKTEVIIVAGGLGRRMGEAVPKAFLLLGGQPLLYHAVLSFSELPEIASCIVVVPGGEEGKGRDICGGMSAIGKVKEVVCGGPRRQDSVRCGMDYLDAETEWVLIHDAARPLCTPELIRRVISATQKNGAAVPGVPLADTLKRVDDEGRVAATVDRRHLVAIQTPQGFKTSWLREAYQHAWQNNLTATDDAGLVEYLKYPIAVVDGETHNFKITRPFDLEMAEILYRKKK